MKMKGYLLTALLATHSLLWGAAPSTVEDTYFHCRDHWPSTRSSEEIVVRLNKNGSFETVYTAIGNALSTPSPYSLFARDFPQGGKYVYTQLDDTRGQIQLITTSETSTHTLIFQTANTGTLEHVRSAMGSFYFTAVEERDEVPLVNISARGSVARDKPLIVGFVVPGKGPRMYVVRVSGPSLKEFGVEHVWADPDFSIHAPPSANYEGPPNAHYADWTAVPSIPGTYNPRPAFERLFSVVGTWIPSSTKEAVEVVWATPGAYTVVCTARGDDPGGECLVEVYALP